MSDVFVLDACAVIALIRNERGSEVVEEVLKKASENKDLLIMNKLNLLETYYDTLRSHNKQTADELLVKIKLLPIKIIPEITDDVFIEAGRLKAHYKISLADAVALGEASVWGGSLLTSDHHEFDEVEHLEPIKFHWIR
jgi:predicted nucleic acid-binding protein